MKNIQQESSNFNPFKVWNTFKAIGRFYSMFLMSYFISKQKLTTLSSCVHNNMHFIMTSLILLGEILSNGHRKH